MRILKYKSLLAWLLLLFFSSSGFSQQSLDTSQEISRARTLSELKAYVASAPFKMKVPSLPQIPALSDTVLRYGAVGDGLQLSQEAIQKTIDAVAARGGGQVVVPPGIYLTGPIRLASRIDLHLMEGAVLLFTSDHSHYEIEVKNNKALVASPIIADDLTDIAITGTGIINGRGETWRPMKKEKATEKQWKQLIKSGGALSEDGLIWWPSLEAGEGASYLKQLNSSSRQLTQADFLAARDFLRPDMVLITDCKRVLIEGVTLMNAPKFGLVPKRCEDLVIKDVKINNEWYAQNGDGMDIGDSKRVVVYRCQVTAGDDAICMKSNYAKKDSGTARLRDVIIADSKVFRGHGGFVIGSNEGGGMSNIFVKNCSFIGTDEGVRVKSARDRGGLVENIFLEDLLMEDIEGAAISFDSFYDEKKIDRISKAVTLSTPIFRKFYFKNIFCTSAESGIRITGLPEMPVSEIYFEKIRIRAAKAYEAVFARDIHFKDALINGVKM